MFNLCSYLKTNNREQIGEYSGSSVDLLSESVDVAVACKFAMMRLRSRPILLDDAFYLALTKQLKRDYKCNNINISAFFNELIISRFEKTREILFRKNC